MACAVAFPTLIKDRDFKFTVLARKHSQISCPFFFPFHRQTQAGEEGLFASGAYKALQLGFREESLGLSFPSFMPHSLLPAMHPK